LVLLRGSQFDLPLGSEQNAKCKHFFDEKVDGLKQPWTGVCWCNPPYGGDLHPWVEKAYQSSLQGATVVGLLPSRTGTDWFKEIAEKFSEIEYVRGRLKYGDTTGSAPFY